MKRRGVSMLEIVIGALVLGISGVVVIELIRSNTTNLQLTEIEAVSRGLAADLLERYSRPTVNDQSGVGASAQAAMGVPAKWDTLLADPAFNHGFPKDKLSKILEEYGVMFNVERKNYTHASYGAKNDMVHVSVTVKWLDLGPGGARNAAGEYKSVTYGCLIDP